jgi:hypothetical protein
MQHIKCIVKFEKFEFKIKVQRPCTVAQLQIKIRKFLKLSEFECIFLFFEIGYFRRARIFSGSKLLSDILRQDTSEVLKINVLKENAFGSLDRRFISAEIKELGGSGAWCLKINYSFYNLYEFTEVFVFKSQLEAERKLLIERCHGFLNIKDKGGSNISIEPAE